MRLNRAQGEAVEHGEGPLLVLAGAGSGKTRVITHRIARLVERGVPARAIVALTFTNKAAGEMRERVAALVSGPAGARKGRAARAGDAQAPPSPRSTPSASTSSGESARRSAGASPSSTRATRPRSSSSSCATRAPTARTTPPPCSSRISNAKNAFLETDELPRREGDAYDEITQVVYPRYQAALQQFHAFDFDDLVCEVARLWREREDVRARWQGQYLYVLVDEYQDTNRAQLEMLRLLCGDPAKRVRGRRRRPGHLRVARRRRAQHPRLRAALRRARVIKLEQNYRSLAPILAVANAVIAKRTDSKWRKVLFTERAGGRPVRVAVAPTPEVEASWVGREIRRLLRDEGKRPRDIAVLYRSNGQSRLLEESAARAGRRRTASSAARSSSSARR